MKCHPYIVWSSFQKAVEIYTIDLAFVTSPIIFSTSFLLHGNIRDEELKGLDNDGI